MRNMNLWNKEYNYLNNKEITMKTTRKSNKKNATETYEWLMATTRLGRRIEKLSWKRLAKIYYANRPGSRIRKAINSEARRCGYTPRTILGLNAE